VAVTNQAVRDAAEKIAAAIEKIEINNNDGLTRLAEAIEYAADELAAAIRGK
jgi:hypothetical protein